MFIGDDDDDETREGKLYFKKPIASPRAIVCRRTTSGLDLQSSKALDSLQARCKFSLCVSFGGIEREKEREIESYASAQKQINTVWKSILFKRSTPYSFTRWSQKGNL